MQNNFDAVRLLLALIVVFCHVAVLTDLAAFKPFLTFLSSDFAVKGFFVISGCLVTRSYASSKSGWEYIEKRVRRIYPAYVTAIILAFLIGIMVTSLSAPDFMRNGATYRYIAANATFLNFLQPTLPGVFEQQPVSVINGSLWTIKVELCLYGCVPVLVWLFARIGRYPTMVLVFALSLGWNWLLTEALGNNPKMAAELGRQFPGMLHFFMLGALFTIDEVQLSPWLGWLALSTWVILLCTGHEGIRSIAQPICYASTVLFLATRLPVQLHAGKWGDLSYGTYLLHFPLIQMFIHFGAFQHNPWLGLIGLLFVVIIAAFALWHGVEKHWLKRSSNYIVAERVNVVTANG